MKNGPLYQIEKAVFGAEGGIPPTAHQRTLFAPRHSLSQNAPGGEVYLLVRFPNLTSRYTNLTTKLTILGTKKPRRRVGRRGCWGVSTGAVSERRPSLV